MGLDDDRQKGRTDKQHQIRERIAGGRGEMGNAQCLLGLPVLRHRKSIQGGHVGIRSARRIEQNCRHGTPDGRPLS